MRESCLDLPSSDRYFQVRGYLMKTFRNNEDICKLICFFEWRTRCEITHVYGEDAEVPEDISPWIRFSLTEIGMDLLGTVSRPKICEALRVLEALEVIDKNLSSGKKNTYRINRKLLNLWMRTKHVVPEDLLTSKILNQSDDDDQLRNLPVPVKNFTGDQSISEPVSYISSSSLAVLNTSPIVPVPEEQNQTPDFPTLPTLPPAAPPPDEDLDLETPIGKFARYVMRDLKGRAEPKLHVRSNRHLLEKLERLERDRGAEEIRRALTGFYKTETDWLREHHWPLAAFLDNVAVYATGEMEPDPAFSRTSGHSGMPSRQTTPYAEPSPGPDQDPIHPQPALPTPREILDEWNAALPERRYPSARPPTSAVLRDPEFIAVRASVFAKVKAALEKDTANQLLWLNFGWVCREKDGNANWIKVMEGTIDSLQAVKTGGRGTRASESVNKARQWIAEWGKKPQAGPPAAPGQPGT